MSDHHIQRNPIPKNNVERFIGMVWNLAEAFGVDKLPEIKHHIELLERSADYHLFEKERGSNQAPRVGEAKRRFIVVFKNRHRLAMDYDYPSQILPSEISMISHLLDKLSAMRLDGDFYLAWFFDQFLVENPKFNPPSIKLSCSSLCWQKFVYSTRDKVKEINESHMRQEEELDLSSRCRALLRDAPSGEFKLKVGEIAKKYRDGGIMFTEFRKAVIDMESSLKATR